MATIIDNNNIHTTVKVGDYIAESLASDNRIWEVVKTTAKTITLRSTKRGELVKKENIDGNQFPVAYYAVESDPEGATRILRERASVRPGYFAFRFGYPVNIMKGQPLKKVDYRY